MLHEFVNANRDEFIARARGRVAARASLTGDATDLTDDISVLIDQVATALRLARSSGAVNHEELSRSASRHGEDRLRAGHSIAQVVLDYGDICQAITELAVEQRALIEADEFQTLNICLDNAIAEAVTSYSRQKELTIAAESTERLGVFAHELRNHLNVATLSFESIKSGRVSPSGSTGLIHSRSLLGLRDLIDRSLAAVRLDAGIEQLEPILVAEFIEDVQIGALMQAQSRGIQFAVSQVDREVTVDGDRQILAAAISNLLQNAFKFTKPASHVSLTTQVTADRVRFEVEDECGGLAPGSEEDLFQPYSQGHKDRSGLGLGLAICERAAKAHAGELHVRSIAGKGCIFSLDLPRRSLEITRPGR